MTTRRGEPIETKRVGVEAILRPLAESDDPRFEALRTGDYVDRLRHFRGIDASLGAIVRAAAACGLFWITLQTNSDGRVACFFGHPDSEQARETLEFGATPGEALAKALVAAVGDNEGEGTEGGEPCSFARKKDAQ